MLFLGVHGVDERAGLTTPNLVEAETDRALIAAARRVWSSSPTHTKWGVVGLQHASPTSTTSTSSSPTTARPRAGRTRLVANGPAALVIDDLRGRRLPTQAGGRDATPGPSYGDPRSPTAARSSTSTTPSPTCPASARARPGRHAPARRRRPRPAAAAPRPADAASGSRSPRTGWTAPSCRPPTSARCARPAAARCRREIPARRLRRRRLREPLPVASADRRRRSPARSTADGAVRLRARPPVAARSSASPPTTTRRSPTSTRAGCAP